MGTIEVIRAAPDAPDQTSRSTKDARRAVKLTRSADRQRRSEERKHQATMHAKDRRHKAAMARSQRRAEAELARQRRRSPAGTADLDALREEVLGHVRRLAKLVGMLNSRMDAAAGLLLTKPARKSAKGHGKTVVPKGTARKPAGMLGKLNAPGEPGTY
jgi:hypothetical protein